MMSKPVFETILGVQVDVLTKPGLLAFVEDDIRQNRKSRIVAINPEKIISCRQDEKLKNLLNGFEYRITDGIGVLLASKLHGGQIKERITGVDTMMDLCALADKHAYRIFLYGSKAEVLKQTALKLKTLYPHLILCGSLDGYQTDQDLIINTINQARPHFLFVALGSPAQEYWISQALGTLSVNLCMGVGGSFDVISETKERAPGFYRHLGLEWFYRLIKEPSRVFRQGKLLVFAGLVLTRWGKGYTS